MTPLRTLGRLLLDFHDLAAAAVPDLRERLLVCLSEAVPFTSAAWASGSLTPQGPDFHTITLWRQPVQLLRDYEALKHLDPLFAQSAQQPGVPVRAIARTSLPKVFLPYIRRYRLEQAMSTMHTDRKSGLLAGVTLWRASRTQPFTEEDAALMEAAFPHLMQIAGRHTLNTLDRAASGASPAWRAAVDRRGRLHSADPAFAAALAREFPAWTGPDLPEPLLSAARDGHEHRLVLGALTALLSPRGDLTAIRLRPRSAIDALTGRQREVAELGAQGFSHKDIAARLAISPTTARNHLAHAYERLGVSNRAELASLLLHDH